MQSTTLNIAKNTVVAFGPGLRPVKISCLGGLIWVTIDGSREDYLVVAGQAVRFDRKGRIVIEALRASTVCLERGRESQALIVFPPDSRTMSNTPVAVP